LECLVLWNEMNERVPFSGQLSTTFDPRPYKEVAMKALRILIADDYEVVRCGVRALLQEHEGWEVCGEAVDGRDAVTKAAQLRPNLVILDIGMPNLNGLEAARQILYGAPETPVLILTMDQSQHSV
jgi:DNA-binding NarL/FixJ family response regulator